MNRKLIENEDYYVENGLLVFTTKYLKERGYCCKNGCRHCPFGYKKARKIFNSKG
jgi:hypothetical protein